MQRSVRENISLPWTAPAGRWGPINLGREQRAVPAADVHHASEAT